MHLFEQGVESPDIARETGHSLKSVERYLNDYERVRMLLKDDKSAAEINTFIRRGKTSMSLKIQLLGSLAILDNDQPHPLTRNAKGCVLLAYLIIVTGKPHPRENLADLLWDAPSTPNALRNLRALISRVRPHLPGLSITRKTLTYTPAAGEQIDYLALTSALSGTEGRPPLAAAALHFYRGALLEGFYLRDAPRFQEWLTLERERLHRAVLDAHRRLCKSLALIQSILKQH